MLLAARQGSFRHGAEYPRLYGILCAATTCCLRPDPQSGEESIVESAKVASQCHIHVPPSENCPRAWRAGSDCAARGNKSQQAGASLADVERQLAAPLWGLPH
jgi:hypothetical protein